MKIRDFVLYPLSLLVFGGEAVLSKSVMRILEYAVCDNLLFGADRLSVDRCGYERGIPEPSLHQVQWCSGMNCCDSETMTQFFWVSLRRSFPLPIYAMSVGVADKIRPIIHKGQPRIPAGPAGRVLQCPKTTGLGFLHN